MKYKADQIFYTIGKFIWIPVLIAGIWFVKTGLSEYKDFFACAIYNAAGIPCPGCGGTRAFYYLAQGKLLKSFFMNPTVIFGFIAYIHFMSLYFWRKHFSKRVSKEISVEVYVYSGIVVILVQWIFKLIKIVNI